jgi:aminoglycoside phosphotransferase (APT) family kinase protein
MNMHEGEVDIDLDVVSRLVAAQFPELADHPISVVRSTGTVNALFRLGDRLCARLPRVEHWARNLDTEWEWLPRLSPRLSLLIPEPVAKGEPTSWYPFSWAIYNWIDGSPYSDELVDDEERAAKDLARFVFELRSLDAEVGAPRGGRRPLRELDLLTREAIESSGDVIDRDAALAAWELALEAPAWDGEPTWIHSDLLRPNVLVDEGRICAVIDFGGVGVGDPAADLIPAWSVFGRVGQETFRGALDADDGTWNRARGFALHQAAMIIPYYPETNPEFVALAKRTVEEILADR